MRIKNLLLTLLIFSCSLQAQITSEFVQNYELQRYFYKLIHTSLFNKNYSLGQIVSYLKQSEIITPDNFESTLWLIDNYTFQKWNSSSWENDSSQVYDYVVSVDEESITGLNNFKLIGNYPNPFNPSTKISWQSLVGSWLTLTIYDVLGNEVATLVDEYKTAGTYELKWSANAYPSGVYFYQLKTDGFVETKKMILMK